MSNTDPTKNWEQHKPHQKPGSNTDPTKNWGATQTPPKTGEQHRPHQNLGVNSGAHEGLTVPASHKIPTLF